MNHLQLNPKINNFNYLYSKCYYFIALLKLLKNINKVFKNKIKTKNVEKKKGKW